MAGTLSLGEPATRERVQSQVIYLLDPLGSRIPRHALDERYNSIIPYKPAT